MSINPLKIFLPVTLALLQGCVQLLPDPSTPPTQFYFLEHQHSLASPPFRSQTVQVINPYADDIYSTNRLLMVQNHQGVKTMTPLAHAIWQDSVPHLVHRSMINFFQKQGSWNVVSREEDHIKPDYILRTEIRHFEIIEKNFNPDEIFIELSVLFSSQSKNKLTHQNIFSRRRPIEELSLRGIVRAYLDTYSLVLQDLNRWVEHKKRL